MRKVIAATFVSLDGVMQAPGGPEEDTSGGFQHGGWTVPYFDDALGASMAELFSVPFELLLGRRTYDIFAAHWPHIASDAPDGEIARLFNATTKHVATHSPETLSWQNTKWLGSNVSQAVRDLKKQDGPVLLIQGSSQLIQTLLSERLIDEQRLLVFPIVLGKGKRLFAEGAPPAAYTVTNATTSPSGVVVATYQLAGDVKTGSFALEQPSAAERARRDEMRR